MQHRKVYIIFSSDPARTVYHREVPLSHLQHHEKFAEWVTEEFRLSQVHGLGRYIHSQTANLGFVWISSEDEFQEMLRGWALYILVGDTSNGRPIFDLPPNFAADPERLRAWLVRLRGTARALEVRIAQQMATVAPEFASEPRPLLSPEGDEEEDEPIPPALYEEFQGPNF